MVRCNVNDATGTDIYEGGTQFSGVQNIVEGSTQVDASKAEPGNSITFNWGGNDKYAPYNHVGIIVEVGKDKDGKIVSYKIIDCGGTEGPRNSTIGVGGLFQ